MRKNKLQRNKGYTLLFAVLVSSLVLSISLSILTITRKEFLIAVSARDSASAFYAADAGLECAVYADRGGRDAFKTDGSRISMTGCYFEEGPTAWVVDTTPTPPPTGVVTKFQFQVKVGTAGDTSCAIVNVDISNDAQGIPRTDITSYGYNNGWAGGSCSTPSAKRVERAIHYRY
jgi:hypothetical protein